MEDDERARELEAEAFLASVTPKLMANADRAGGLPVGQRSKVTVKQPQSCHDARVTLATNLSKLQQREEARQNAIQRIQGTHRSVNSLEKSAESQQQPVRGGGTSPAMPRSQLQQAGSASSASPPLRPKSPTPSKPPVPTTPQTTPAPPGSRSPTPAKPPPPPTLGTQTGKKQQQVNSIAASSFNGRPVSPTLGFSKPPASKTTPTSRFPSAAGAATSTVGKSTLPPAGSSSPIAARPTAPLTSNVSVHPTPPPAGSSSPVAARPTAPPTSNVSVPKPPPVIKVPSPANNTSAVKANRSPSPTSQVTLDPVVSKPAGFAAKRFASPTGAVYSSVQKALESQIDDDLAQELAKSKAAEYFSSRQKAAVGAGKLGGQFKGALNEKLTGASTLCKTEEELLATMDKTGKPQLGRVLDDPSPASYKPQLGRVLDDPPISSQQANHKSQLGRVLDNAPTSSQPAKATDNPPFSSQKAPVGKASSNSPVSSRKPLLGTVINGTPAMHKPQLGKVVDNPTRTVPVETSAPPPPPPSSAMQPAPPPVGGFVPPPPPLPSTVKATPSPPLPPSAEKAAPSPSPPSIVEAVPPPPPPSASGTAAPPPPPPPPPPPVGYVPPKKPLSTQETTPRKTSPQPNRAAMIPGGASLQAELQKKLTNRMLANSNNNSNNNLKLTFYKFSTGVNNSVNDGPQTLARNGSDRDDGKLQMPTKNNWIDDEPVACTQCKGVVLPWNHVIASDGKSYHNQCFKHTDHMDPGRTCF